MFVAGPSIFRSTKLKTEVGFMKRRFLFLSAALVVVLNAPATAHIGITKFVPEVPDPAAMTMDGDEEDWGWMDESFAITMDQIVDYRERDFTTEDYNLVYFVGWSRVPDNQFYFFTRINDDTLRIAEEDQKRWWNDDFLQITFDSDHSGGWYLGENMDEVNNGQRYHLRQLPLAGQRSPFNGIIEYIDIPELAWSAEEEWFELGQTLLPAGAAHLSTNVEYTFEFRCALWDIHQVTPDESVRHILAPERVIHVGVRFDDGDGGEQGGKHLFGLAGGSIEQDTQGEHAPDFIPIDTLERGSVTAVKEQGWGRIKSYLHQRLR
jgi:hypothetical protein